MAKAPTVVADKNLDENGFTIYPKYLWNEDAVDGKGKKINEAIIDPATGKQALAEDEADEKRLRKLAGKSEPEKQPDPTKQPGWGG